MCIIGGTWILRCSLSNTYIVKISPLDAYKWVVNKHAAARCSTQLPSDFGRQYLHTIQESPNFFSLTARFSHTSHMFIRIINPSYSVSEPNRQK